MIIQIIRLDKSAGSRSKSPWSKVPLSKAPWSKAPTTSTEHPIRSIDHPLNRSSAQQIIRSTVHPLNSSSAQQFIRSTVHPLNRSFTSTQHPTQQIIRLNIVLLNTIYTFFVNQEPMLIHNYRTQYNVRLTTTSIILLMYRYNPQSSPVLCHTSKVGFKCFSSV